MTNNRLGSSKHVLHSALRFTGMLSGKVELVIIIASMRNALFFNPLYHIYSIVPENKMHLLREIPFIKQRAEDLADIFGIMAFRHMAKAKNAVLSSQQ